MAGDEIQKRERGQFFTATDPFTHPAFRQWLHGFSKNEEILEPFAGANNLIKMLQKQGLASSYTSFDIEPQEPSVIERNTLKNFPTGFQVCVTNPPYLAKNSATRRKIVVDDFGGYDNLWKHSTNLCLQNCQYVAAIIPESFLTSGLFRERLQAVISLPYNMFDDTEQPVCLALWVPEPQKDFRVFHGSKNLGTFTNLQKKVEKLLPAPKRPLDLTFNDRAGLIGLRAVDNTKGPSIAFAPGKEIDPEEIKHTSRHLTRIAINSRTHKSTKAIIEDANRILSQYRAATDDVFMTSFKGLREDGQFRRRLDFATARRILEVAALS